MDEKLSFDTLQKLLAGVVEPKETPSAQLVSTDNITDSEVKQLIRDSIGGLLLQSSMTPEQLSLLSLLVHTWNAFRGD